MPAVTPANRLASLSNQLNSTDNTPPSRADYIPESGRNALEGERHQASFDTTALCHYVSGGKEQADLRARMFLQFERDPHFRLDDYYDLTKNEQRQRVMTRLRSMIHFVNSETPADFSLRMQLLVLVDPGFLTRLAVHYGLFLNTIVGQGTREQVDHWIGKGAVDFKGLIGCFAMTELGHGSNVAGLETTATFDRETDEFVIHTPSLTATKWWIGGAAESATHSTVFAKLIIDGQAFGVKPFVVPLRDPQTFELLPGVTIGDCGAKMGRNAIDNGWIQFTFVRIPRTNMLMKYTKVSRDGKVTEPPMAQLAYGALINGRVAITRESGECAKKAITIAIRYACVRRQFGGGKAVLETKIMDYQTHQQRLIPLLALTYGIIFASAELEKTYQSLIKSLARTKPGDPTMEKVIESLKETHATSAGLKAFCTWKTLELIEQCRQSLGGQGYSSYAGLATLFQDFAVQCTWEGDNTVLTLQTGRYLIACVRDRTRGKKVPDGVGYLNEIPEILGRKCKQHVDLASFAFLDDAFNAASANHAVAAAKAFQELVSQGLTDDEAHLKSGVQKFAAAKMHCMGYLFRQFRVAAEQAPAGLRLVLSNLCILYGLSCIQENSGAFLQYGFLQPSHLGEIQKKSLEILAVIRPQLVPLTDSFGLPDYAINSPLGCYDGDVYRRMFERVKASTPFHKHRYYDDTIKPVLHRTDSAPERIQMGE